MKWFVVDLIGKDFLFGMQSYCLDFVEVDSDLIGAMVMA
jgi:hypothetical protein